jgi:hypothetical protein
MRVLLTNNIDNLSVQRNQIMNKYKYNIYTQYTEIDIDAAYNNKTFILLFDVSLTFSFLFSDGHVSSVVQIHCSILSVLSP